MSEDRTQAPSSQPRTAKDPAHLAAEDRIIAWLDDHIEGVIEPLLPQLGFRRGHKTILFERYDGGPTPEDRARAIAQLERGTQRVIRRVWQKPITERSRIVGFVDLAVELEVSHAFASVKRVGGDEALLARLRGERCETPSPAEWNWEITAGRSAWIGFKVAPAIRSVSELIRKVRTLEAHAPDVRFVVVSPDAQHAERFTAQRIPFVAFDSTERSAG